MFKQRGHEVKFIVYGESDFFVDKLNRNNTEIVKIKSKNNISRLFKIRKFVRKRWQDIVISFLETSNFIACFSAIGKHKWKLITNERSCNELSFKGIKNKIYKKFERFSDYTICNSNVARDLWIKHIPKFKDKIGVIYNYIDISYIYDDVEYTPLNNGVVNISVVASYQYIKNVVTVVKALSMLTDEERKKLKINWCGRIEVVEGDTRAYDEACELINYYSLNSIIELHKENKNIYSIMKQSDFVGLFIVYEGLPNVICEALCLGKHIIMIPVSDYYNLVKNNGFYVLLFKKMIFY